MKKNIYDLKMQNVCYIKTKNQTQNGIMSEIKKQKITKTKTNTTIQDINKQTKMLIIIEASRRIEKKKKIKLIRKKDHKS